MSLVFNEQDHTYKLNGVLIPSVSTLLDPLYDFRFVSQENLEKARKKGKAIHRTIELYEKGTLDQDTLHPFLASCLKQWIDFKQVMGYVASISEHMVHSDQFGYAGTLDGGGKMGDFEMLLDVKSGSKYEPHKLQTMGYKIAAVERKILSESCKRGSIYIDHDSWDFEYHHDEGGDRAAFLSLLTIHKWRQKNVRVK